MWPPAVMFFPVQLQIFIAIYIVHT